MESSREKEAPPCQQVRGWATGPLLTAFHAWWLCTWPGPALVTVPPGHVHVYPTGCTWRSHGLPRVTSGSIRLCQVMSGFLRFPLAPSLPLWGVAQHVCWELLFTWCVCVSNHGQLTTWQQVLSVWAESHGAECAVQEPWKEVLPQHHPQKRCCPPQQAWSALFPAVQEFPRKPKLQQSYHMLLQAALCHWHLLPKMVLLIPQPWSPRPHLEPQPTALPAVSPAPVLSLWILIWESQQKGFSAVLFPSWRWDLLKR